MDEWCGVQVLTFGCNDEGALGRRVADEEECMLPEKVELPEKIVLVSAGDSHTAALSASGRLFAWGTFRVSFTSHPLPHSIGLHAIS